MAAFTGNLARIALSAFALHLAAPSLATGAAVSSISFPNISVPADEFEKRAVRLVPGARVTYTDGTSKEITLEYRTLARSGQRDTSGGSLGRLHDIEGAALKHGGRFLISDYPDGSTALKRGDKVYFLTNFEGYPGSVYLTETRKEAGALKAYSFKEVDLSPVKGAVFSCAASKTPWDTHLFGEEDYAFDPVRFDPALKSRLSEHVEACGGPDGPRGYFCSSVASMKRYLKGRYELDPYEYGHIVEISIDEKGWARAQKRLSMGKFSPETALVMPDERTAYATDDGVYGGLFMFVADRPRDLSSGALYMARWVSKNGPGKKDEAYIAWKRLGRSSDEEISEILAKGPVFTDIFDAEDPANCPEGFTLIKAGNPSAQCLRLKDGSNGSTISKRFNGPEEARTAAAFLETRRFGALAGGTAEFRKEEGIAYDPASNTLYVAFSTIDKSMVANPADPEDHVKLQGNACGALYALKLARSEPLGSAYAANEALPVLAGVPLKPGEPHSEEGGCHPDHIANPDNLGFAGGTLFIGEDSDYRVNNLVWAYEPKTGRLSRIMSVPAGSEPSGSFTTVEIDGDLHVMINIQHPFRDTAINAAGAVVGREILKTATEAEKRGHVGFIIIPGPGARKP